MPPRIATGGPRAVGEKLAYIDNARGLAILLVILVHCNQPVQGLSEIAHSVATYGQSGVQLFFVTSAFTLCMSQQRHADSDASWSTFMLRRLFRIAPLYYLGVLLYFSANWFVQHTDPTAPATLTAPYTLPNIAANLLLIHGFVRDANNSVVPGGWSIGTEMAFYLIFPLVFAMFARLQRLGIGALTVTVGAVALANLAVQAWLVDRRGVPLQNNSFEFYHLLNQLPVFLLGLLFFFAVEGRRTTGRGTGRSAGLIGTSLRAGIGFVLATATTIALWESDLPLAFALVPPGLGVSFVCLLALMRQSGFDLPWLRAIGQASYWMYIVHFVVVWYAMKWLAQGLPGTVAPETVWLVGFVLVTVISFALARTSQRTVEAGGIALGQRVIARLQARRRTARGAALDAHARGRNGASPPSGRASSTPPILDVEGGGAQRPDR